MTKTWRERVAVARERGFTAKDRADAGSWLTCAIGEQSRSITPLQVLPVSWNGVRNPELATLGLEFAEAVMAANDPARADDILDQIEDRVLQLKREYTDGGSTQGGDA